MELNKQQQTILAVSIVTFAAFLAGFVTDRPVLILAAGVITPVLLMVILYLGVEKEPEPVDFWADSGDVPHPVHSAEPVVLTAPADTPNDTHKELPAKRDQEAADRPAANVDNLINQLVERREQLESAQAELASTQAQLDEVNEKLLEANLEKETLRREKEELISERDRLLQEMADKKEQYNKAVSSILPKDVKQSESIVMDISRAAQKAVEDMSEAAAKVGIRLAVVHPAEPIRMKADPVMLDVLFKNIIDNSIKYMDKIGVMQITISQVDGDLFVVLKDNGAGMADNETEHIFELNYQGTNRVSGNGLGLAQARAIVEYYGGVIYARSKRGQGMGIYIHLPGEVEQTQQEVEA